MFTIYKKIKIIIIIPPLLTKWLGMVMRRMNTRWESNPSANLTVTKQVKNSRMTFFVQWDSEVCIRWTLYYPMRPQETSYEWQWSDATSSKSRWV